jgi:hypothetical protein
MPWILGHPEPEPYRLRARHLFLPTGVIASETTHILEKCRVLSPTGTAKAADKMVVPRFVKPRLYLNYEYTQRISSCNKVAA